MAVNVITHIDAQRASEKITELENAEDYVVIEGTALTGTTYTFAATDEDAVIVFTGGSAATYTVPPNSSVALPTGAIIDIVNNSASAVAITVAAGAGVTVVGAALTIAQKTVGQLVKIAINTWMLRRWQ